jgi:hypothetical protein
MTGPGAESEPAETSGAAARATGASAAQMSPQASNRGYPGTAPSSARAWPRRSAMPSGVAAGHVAFLQPHAGNRAVARLVTSRRMLQRDGKDTEVAPEGPWWQAKVSAVRSAVGRGDFVNYTASDETAGAYWIINPLNADDRAKIMTMLSADLLDALLDFDDQAIEAGVPNAVDIADKARVARAQRKAPARDPLKVVVRGTWVDDFKEVRYDMDYRIDEGGSPSEWMQVYYKDGTKIDLNWHDFEDVKLDVDQMKDALQNRYIGAGGRIFPKRKAANGRLGLTKQLCPRLWAAHQEITDIGAESTINLMLLSLPAIMFVLTIAAAPLGPEPEGATGGPKVTRRAVSRPGSVNFASQQQRAQQLASAAQQEGREVVANIGGAGARHEPQGAININNQAVARKDIPNLVQADGSRIGELFKPGTVDRVEGHNMAPGAIDWNKAAPGSMQALKPGGKVSYYYRGSNADAKVAETALKQSGFKDVKNVGDVWITATKPGG